MHPLRVLTDAHVEPQYLASALFPPADGFWPTIEKSNVGCVGLADGLPDGLLVGLPVGLLVGGTGAGPPPDGAGTHSILSTSHTVPGLAILQPRSSSSLDRHLSSPSAPPVHVRVLQTSSVLHPIPLPTRQLRHDPDPDPARLTAQNCPKGQWSFELHVKTNWLGTPGAPPAGLCPPGVGDGAPSSPPPSPPPIRSAHGASGKQCCPPGQSPCLPSGHGRDAAQTSASNRNRAPQ